MAKSKINYFTDDSFPTGIVRGNYVAVSRIDHDLTVATKENDVPLMRVRGTVHTDQTKESADGRLYILLIGSFVATPCDGGPEFEPMASGKFIPPDCVAGELAIGGTDLDIVIFKRYSDKSPCKYTLVVEYSPKTEASLRELQKNASPSALPSGEKKENPVGEWPRRPALGA